MLLWHFKLRGYGILSQGDHSKTFFEQKSEFSMFSVPGPKLPLTVSEPKSAKLK